MNKAKEILEQALSYKNCDGLIEENSRIEDVVLYAINEALRQPPVSSSCSCGIPYVETKKSDIPYDTYDNVYYTDILIHHCPKCGNIDRIDEY